MTGFRLRAAHALALVAALAVLPALADAADKVSIIVGGLEKQVYLPAMLSQRLGNFQKEGLDVELLNARAGVEAENELLAGGVQGVVGFYDHTIDMQAKGKFIQTIVQFAQAPGEVELVSTKLAGEITSPAQLKGRTLGITGLGSSTEFLTRYLAVRAGLKEGDYSLLGVGAGNTFIAGMRQGAIAAGMTTEPTISQMLKTGDAKILVDMRTPELTRAALGGTYPGASFYVQAAWVQKNPEIAARLARAFVATLRFMATHSAEEIADQMPKDYYVGDRALYVKALADGMGQWTRDGRMPEDGPETVLKVLSAFNRGVAGKKIDLARTYTNQFVDGALQQIAK